MRRRTADRARRQEIVVGLAMLAPMLVALVVLRLWPAVLALATSLGSDDPARWFDLSAYGDLFRDPVFLGSLLTTSLYSLLVNPFQIAVALGLALLLARHLPGAGLWRTLVVLPVVIPQSVSAVIWGVASPPGRARQRLPAASGLPAQPFLTSPSRRCRPSSWWCVGSASATG